MYNASDFIKKKTPIGYEVFLNDKKVGRIDGANKCYSLEITGAKDHPYLFSCNEQSVKNCMFRIAQLYTMCDDGTYSNYVKKFEMVD